MNAPRNLAFHLAPSPGVIFGCLLPAPWLGMVAGLLLALGPVEGLPHRFAPLSLSLVHVLALGMLLPVMLGALFQLFPVLAGVPVPATRWLAPWVAPCCVGTVGGLVWGFLGSNPTGFILGGTIATIGVGSVVIALVVAGWQVIPTNASTRVLRWIAWALLVTVLLGAALAGVLAYGWGLPLRSVLDLHVAWGAGGWLAVLLAGVAATVLPMFWQTPKLDARLSRLLPGLIWLPLALGLLELAGLPAPWRPLCWLALCLLASLLLYAALKAKRKHDVAWPLWGIAALSWWLAAVLGLLEGMLPADWPIAWWLGVLILVGGAVLPINAMLGKIIPFLVWLHLRRQLPAHVRVPAMQTLLPPALQWIQVMLVLFAWLCLLMLPIAPARLALPAGLLFAASQASLGGLLLYVLSRYLQLAKT
ncbi:hypothetical protein GCM10007907_37220 [Chitinimonas prasina]|uniref:NnrS family protein n=1 Tax=Chitinimonas prasina TaxID=1434937 RepID=A0ABQ5YK78_9NEIS|nr:hypothetical protein [Chitinimonas prasina]GLR14932.1 hypothetical protein GCM10007907_37220 [Chitinimonas prasina]